MEEKENTRFAYSVEGVDAVFSSDWAGQEIFKEGKKAPEGSAREFAEKFTDLWMDKLGELGTVIEEETDFEFESQDEVGQNYRGTSFYSRFRLFMPYMPTDPEQVRIYYMTKTHIGNADEVREELEEEDDEEAAA